MKMDTGNDWFHGKLSREDAENILLEEAQISNSDGIFLVRESSKSSNSYILSVYYDVQFWHYQIQQHTEDSFFSIDGENTIHGLEYLIEYCRNNDDTTLCTKLKNYVKKSPPPIGTRRHGNSNLLHRATKHNQLTVVKEMLKTTYRNLDAKDEHGMTAVHLCCMNRVNPEIIKLLIERGASLSSRDSSGNTPLHYACENQCKEMVELLVNANKNLIQLRNSETGDVPLHYAAKAGNIEIVEYLLSKHAPPMPRTSDGQFPADLAEPDSDVARFLAEYKAPIRTLRNKWYHGTLDRKEASQRLMEKREELYDQYKNENPGDENAYVNMSKEIDELISGTFLVRLSERNSDYVLTVLLNNENIEYIDVRNYKIEKDKNFLYIDDGPYMASLEHLISHYMEFPDGLPVSLRTPVEPKPRPPVPLIPPMKRKSFENSPTKPLPSPSSSSTPNTPESSKNSKDIPKTSWMNSLPSVFTRKKKQQRSMSKDEKSMPDISPVINGFKTLSFSTDMLATGPQDSYDVPPPAPKKHHEPDYFTESDENAAMSDNCIEEIYFVDAPVEMEKQVEWNQLDPELYDTQKNLMTEMNRNTGANYYVSKSDLMVQHEIGSGEFAEVLRGVYRFQSGKKIFVAIKTLHKEHYEENLACFLREASVMIKLDNDYIVKLIGITKGPPIGLVQELLPLGSLATYLVNYAEEIDVKNMHLWASQIAQGMEYLESKRFVHRDLAARNILLASKIHCKISDFGLSRAIGIDKEIYTSSTGGRWPLKWYAPEHVYGIFSHASDVWSFGITLWEIYSKGQPPYGDLSGSEVNERIEKGERLPQPEFCPDEIYFKIMIECWQYHARLRPNFQFLARFFINILKTPPETPIEDDESQENDETDKQDSNTVYV